MGRLNASCLASFWSSKATCIYQRSNGFIRNENHYSADSRRFDRHFGMFCRIQADGTHEPECKHVYAQKRTPKNFLHSCRTHSCRKPLWDTLVHSCRTPCVTLTLVGHSCGTLGHSCVSLLRNTTGREQGSTPRPPELNENPSLRIREKTT